VDNDQKRVARYQRKVEREKLKEKQTMAIYNDMAVPEIKLVQNVGGDEAKELGAKPGQFYCKLTGEIMDTFEMVVSGRASVERTYWGSDHEVQSDEPPTCSSQDGITSAGGDLCATACPYNAFTDTPGFLKADERKLKCTPGFKVSGINLSNMMPVFIRCGGISAGAARELNTLITFHKNIRGRFYTVKFTVTSIKRKGASGEAFAIKFSEPTLLDVEQLEEVKGLLEDVLGEPLSELTSRQSVQKALEPGIKREAAPESQVITNGDVGKVEELFSPEQTINTLNKVPKTPGYVENKDNAPGTVIISGNKLPVQNQVPPAVQKAADQVKKRINLNI
jgi:hypothetical protein